MHTQNSPRTLINTDSYPLTEPTSTEYSALVEEVRHELSIDGCAVISNFLSDYGLTTLLQEALDRAPQAYFSPNKDCNVYFSNIDTQQPPEHPVNILLPRTNGFVTADLFDDQSASKTLYNWPPLSRFLADCLSKDKLYIYADPVSNMIVNVGKPGQQFNWHFDTNEFTITMLLQPAEQGGQFQYVPDLRSAEDECFDDVSAVLKGDDSRTKKLQLKAGDLQFFLGRFSLHQVTVNTGNTERLLLIMSFSEVDGVIGNVVRVKDLYGKVTNDHFQQPTRADSLYD